MQKRTLSRVRFPMAASRAVKSEASTLYTFSRRGFFSSLLGLLHLPSIIYDVCRSRTLHL